MTKLFVVAAAVTLTGCSSAEERQQQALMDQIESQVEFPRNAWRMEEYARYYADAGDGTIIGSYLLPTEGPDWEIPADERRWLKDGQTLPAMNDGGCAQINVVFDKAKSSVLSVTCNAEL